METTPALRMHRTKKSLAILFAVAVFALLAIFSVAQWIKRVANPLSEDAVLGAAIVNISAGVPGKIKKMYVQDGDFVEEDRKSTRLNSSHVASSYAVFCLK